MKIKREWEQEKYNLSIIIEWQQTKNSKAALTLPEVGKSPAVRHFLKVQKPNFLSGWYVAYALLWSELKVAKFQHRFLFWFCQKIIDFLSWKFLIKYTRHYDRIYFYFLILRTSTDFFKSSRDFCHYGLMLLISVIYKVQNLEIWGNFLKMWPLKEGKNELTNW